MPGDDAGALQSVIDWIARVCAPPFNGFAAFALGCGLVALAVC
jgi:hypothetical protein